MSHASGITVDDELNKTFQSLRLEGEDTLRAVHITIENEQLVQKDTAKTEGDFQADYEAKLVPLIEQGKAGYYFMRTDKTQAGEVALHLWILIVYVPDSTPVRQKMLYASTKSTVRREFGDSLITDDLFGTVIDDVDYKGYLAHLKSDAAPPPMSIAEQENAEIKLAENNAHISASGRHEISNGVSFPFLDEAKQALVQFKNKEVQYVQLALDVNKEVITLALADNTTTNELESKTPSDSPRYHFLAYPHESDGQEQRPIVFIYSCPGFNCPIKERMLYASCKNEVISIAVDCGVTATHKMEVSDGSELTHEALHTEVHPPVVEATKRIVKPKGPGRSKTRPTRATE